MLRFCNNQSLNMGNLNLHSKYDISQSIGNQFQSNDLLNKSNYLTQRRNSMNGVLNPLPNSSSTPSPGLSTTSQLMRQHPVDLGLQDPSLITPYLLLGGAMVNKNPDLVNYLGITHVVNMAVELQPSIDLVGKRSIIYKHIRSDDSLQYNIRVHFEEAFEIIDDARSNNGRVLVHCMMGISRSGIYC